MTTPDVILVLGMHRSGTSVLTAGLRALGADLGSQLMPARAGDNDKGYFENPDVVALNERLLSMDGFHWASLAYGTAIDYDSKRYAELRRSAAGIISGQFGPGVIAIKDPRLCLTLAFWLRVINDCRPGATVQCVHLFRHPAAIAASFSARADHPETRELVDFTQGDPQQSLLLWLSYTYQALRNSLDQPNYCIQQDTLLRNPTSVLTALAAQLRLAIDPIELARFAGSFVNPHLSHHQTAGPIAAAFPQLAFLDPLWQRFESLSGPLTADTQRALLESFPELEFAYSWSVQAKALIPEREQTARLQAELGAMQSSVTVRETKLVKLYAEQDQLRETCAELEHRNAQLQAELAAKQVSVDVRETTLIELYAERDDLRNTLQAAEQQLQQQADRRRWLRPDRQLLKLYRQRRDS